MNAEKTPGEQRTADLHKRLSKTPAGKALATVLNAAGGRTALARALKVSVVQIDNWIRRNKVSKEGAEMIADSGYFNVTREFMRPDLKVFQWGEK